MADIQKITYLFFEHYMGLTFERSATEQGITGEDMEQLRDPNVRPPAVVGPLLLAELKQIVPEALADGLPDQEEPPVEPETPPVEP